MIQKRTSFNNFQTYDLGLAGTLITLGFQSCSLDKLNPKKVQFCFDYSDNIQTSAEAYWAGEVKVNPRTYFDNLKLLKNRIYSDV